MWAGSGPAAAPSKMFESSRPSTRSRLPPGAEPPEPLKPSKSARRRGKGKGSGAAAADEPSTAADEAATQPGNGLVAAVPPEPEAQAPGEDLAMVWQQNEL